MNSELKPNCRVPKCEKQVRRNSFCDYHSKAFKAGVIAVTGERIRPRVRYSKDFQCIKCGKFDTRFRKGFCNFHYQQFYKGLIDFDGSQKRQPKRANKYTEDDFCKVAGCMGKLTSFGWCRKHYRNFKSGYYSASGKVLKQIVRNENKKCLECEERVHCKDLCKSHYMKNRRNKGKYVRNKGRICLAIACNGPAHTKGFCEKHYLRRVRRMAEKQAESI